MIGGNSLGLSLTGLILLTLSNSEFPTALLSLVSGAKSFADPLPQ